MKDTMKKTFILAAMAALLSAVSCSKEEMADNSSAVVSPEFTATISSDSKTTVDVSTGKVSWESTDEIQVTDAAEHTATYKIKEIGSKGKATFEYKSGTQLGKGPYTAEYGQAPSTSQTYSASAGRLYMTAPSTQSLSLTFTVQCGLMNLRLTKAGESIRSIAVTGMPAGKSTATTYTLTCSNESIDSQKSFCIALPAGSYSKVVLTDASGKVCTLNAAGGISISANHIKPVTLGEGKLNFVFPPYVEIKAKYDGTHETTLKWARQNLAISESGKMKWKGGNSTAVKVPGTDEDVINGDYFQWATYAGYCGSAEDSDKGLLIYTSFTSQQCVSGGSSDGFMIKSGKKFNDGTVPYYISGTAASATYSKYNNTDSKVTLESTDDVASIILGGRWRMPTAAEMSALYVATYWAWDDTDTGYYVFKPDASHTAGTRVGSVPADLNKADALLFFPAAGFGYFDSLFNAGSVGSYVLSSLYSSVPSNAYYVFFHGNTFHFEYNYRYGGNTVRPVSD